MAQEIDTTRDAIEARYIIGQRIAEELGRLPTAELKAKLLSILQDQPAHIREMLTAPTSGVRKTYLDDELEKAEVLYYATITVSWSGIFYKPEHGVPVRLVAFNQHFVL
jgi:hypothetical protein